MIDIIIPAYNAEKTLGRALSSLAMQTIADKLYVTVVDDCSDEPIADIIKTHEKSFAQLTHIRLQENGGAGVARHIGMANTTQPFIGFLDADDMYYDVFSIERLYEDISKNDNCIVATGDFLEQSEAKKYTLHQNDMVWCFGKLYRRSFLDKHGIVFNNTRCNEDVGFNTKIVLCKSSTEVFVAVPQPTYVWCFNHQGITKVNLYAYAFSNGIAGYVTNKIDAFEFAKVDPTKIAQGFAVLVQLYKVYTQACYMRPEYVQHIHAQAKRWTDFMFKDGIAEYDLINGIMPCKGELDSITVLPVITIFDFLAKLGVKIKKNEFDKMKYAKRIEVTTVIGCGIACVNCPQDAIKEAYSGAKMLGLQEFKDMLQSVPTDVMICFSGYAEPFINPACTEMILYAHEKGHQVGLYTTMVGMTMNDWNRIKHIPISPLVIHVPTVEGMENIDVDTEYYEKLETIRPHNYSAHGTIPKDIKKRMFNAYIMGADQIHDRAGLVDNNKRVEHHKGQIFCATDMQHPVLLPNGDMQVCCQDFGLQEKIGNLKEQSYDEIMQGELITTLRKKLENGEPTICQKCIMAREL